MKRVMLTMVGICLMLASTGGCNTGCWVKPDLTVEQFRQDCAQCDYEATKASYTPMGFFDSPILSGMQEGSQHAKVYKSCMRAKGYSWKDDCRNLTVIPSK